MLKAAQLLLVFLVFFLPAVDTDLGWHLRYGQYFFETGQFLRENILTYFLADYRWPNPFPLYQPLTFLIYKAGGILGLSAAYGILGALAFWVFDKINPRLQKINLILYLFLYLFSWTVFSLGWRAQFFSFLCLIVVFFIVSRVEKPVKITVLPIIFLIWANLHGGFILGLAVLGLATIQTAITEIRRCVRIPCLAGRQAPQGCKPELLISWGVSTLASAAVALLNPNGIELYKEVLKHAQYPLHTLIAEWVAPKPEIQILIVGITLVALFSVITSHNVKKVFWIPVVVLFAVLALQAKRNLPFFGLVAVLALLEIFSKRLEVIEENIKFKRLAVPLLLAGILILLMFQAPRTIGIDTNWESYCNAREIKQPCRAVEYVRARPVAGQNVFAAYEWGGFLEWQLPQYKYFVDGRMPAWVVPSPYTRYLEIIQARPGWEEKLDSYGTDWLLIGQGTFLDIELRKNRDVIWKEEYRDTAAVIYTKIVVK